MVEQVGNAIPAPSYKGPSAFTTNQELLYSANRFTQKGVQLKAGQGVLKLGTILARETSSKKYVKWVSGGSGGTETPVGILRQSVDTGSSSDAPEYLGNIVISGILKLDLINSANSGSISSAVTALNARADTTLRTFTF